MLERKIMPRNALTGRLTEVLLERGLRKSI
jgi:hypothetical protein